MRNAVFMVAAALALAGCATTPTTQFIPSGKSAVELRAIQSRVVEAGPDDAMRAVIATMHDLGYRITRVSPAAGTVSGARQAELRMAVVVKARTPEESAVRANATLLSPLREAQVDSAEFYQSNFFAPLGDTLGRMPRALGEAEDAPDAARPVAEINTAREREAAAASASSAATAKPQGD